MGFGEGLRFLTGGGSIICRVSSRDLCLAQSPNHPMVGLLIHLLEHLQEEAYEKPISLWMCKQGHKEVRSSSFWLRKLSNIRAKNSISISWFYLYIFISLSLILNL